MNAVSPYGVLNTERSDSLLKFYLCPLQKIDDELREKEEVIEKMKKAGITQEEINILKRK